MSEITKQYVQDIRDWARDDEPKIAEAGRMGQSMLSRVAYKTSRDSLIRTIHTKVQSLANYVEWGMDVDIAKAREELEKEIDRAS